MSKGLHDEFMENENLKNITGLTPIQFSESKVTNNDNLKEDFDLSRRSKIPNLLLKEVAGIKYNHLINRTEYMSVQN